MNRGLSHFNNRGEASMVDVGRKAVTERRAVAACEVRMKLETLKLLKEGDLKKGDAFTVAKTAGILAAKRTPELIPLCHSLLLDATEIRFFDLPGEVGILIESEVCTSAKTGVEMEALTAAAVAALTIYDMAKSYDPAITMTGLHLIKKTGGKSDYDDPHESGNHHGE